MLLGTLGSAVFGRAYGRRFMSSGGKSEGASFDPDAASGSAARSTVPPRSTHATYHPKGYGVSEGLKRARRPYLVRNLITGTAIMSFAVGVYFYSISKVKQDDFSDLEDVRPTLEQRPSTSEEDSAKV
ncbi:hypothetical protein IE53DRAFT_410919 [Violaceomyces palustris]|uniref:Uncharacterized protein n=1 Tax=Violaceomyces palustris TaxID=1673888 RepID=A0ACD0NXA2_9BASI|nr:hypothetical protein IE53DRAFT_410919 [Violaceomyces palustris]